MIPILICLAPLAWPLLWERYIFAKPCWGGDFTRDDVLLQTIGALIVFAFIAVSWNP